MKNIPMKPFANKYTWFFSNIENLYISKGNWEIRVYKILEDYDNFAVMFILEELLEINVDLYLDVKELLRTKNHSIFEVGALFEELNIKNDLHPKFLMLKENDDFLCHRIILNDWFKEFEDRDGKIVKEFQTTFHSSLWEIFLFKVFKDLKYSIDFSKNRPDFILKNKDDKILYVESTTSNIKIDGRKEDDRGFNDILGMMTAPTLNKNFESEVDESIIRYSNSINSKLKKYREDYLSLEWIKKDNPYIIALASYAQVNYGREYIHGILALLYGLYYSTEDKKFIKKEYVKKNDKIKIPLNIFEKEEYSDISAIIFSSNLSIGKLSSLVKSKINNKNQEVFNLYQDFLDDDCGFKLNITSNESPEVLTDGVWIFHNPIAKNKLAPLNFYDAGITNFFKNDEGYYVYGNMNPTISRLNIPNIMCHEYFPKIEIMLEQYNKENFNFVNFCIL